MEIQVATLCDSASDYSGKLCILGTFDTICSSNTPIIHPHCSLALRICFKPGDEGEHVVVVRFIDDDGQPIMPPFREKIAVALPNDAYFLTRNLILNFQRLTFAKTGQFSLDVSVDDEMLARIPLRVILYRRDDQPPQV
ncbi:MAG: hypothetical protein ACI8XO_003330 [Verrucomicrobiales bacterium]|jgi:hypothetical protein